MLKNYHKYILENIQISLDMIIDILKDTKNPDIINKLVNYSDKNGKSVLMSVVHSNRMDLVDFILQYDVDLNKQDNFGRNVLFYCKTLKMFNKFYDKGVDVNFIDNKTNKNILCVLSAKNIFNVKLYQELIDKGIDINKFDKYNNNTLSYSISVPSIVKLLIKNGADINNPQKQFQLNYFHKLFYYFNHYKEKRKGVIDTVKLLFKNGLEFVDPNYSLSDFVSNIVDIGAFNDKDNNYKNFITPLKNILPEYILIKVFMDFNILDKSNVAKYLLNLDIYPTLYKKIKEYYHHNIQYAAKSDMLKFLEEYRKKYPYIEEIEKYNL